MLFHIQMTVNLPPDMDAARLDKLKAREKAMCQDLQTKGIWRHIWRIAGRYANVSVFEVENPAQLHDILINLPLFPYMEVEVQALCRHGSSLTAGDDDR
jgi:muconolactone D-isomerase